MIFVLLAKLQFVKMPMLNAISTDSKWEQFYHRSMGQCISALAARISTMQPHCIQVAFCSSPQTTHACKRRSYASSVVRFFAGNVER